MSSPSSPDRDRDLEEIRATYDRYRREGRGRLWNPANRGFARMMRDRDHALVEFLGRSLPPSGGRVLDLGCGDGRLAAVVQKAGLTIGSWNGVDLDPRAVATASASIPGALFTQASADRLPFDSASFDVVVASTLFSSLPSIELERAVAVEIARVLVSDGWIVWYDLRYDNPRNRAVHGIKRSELKYLFPEWPIELRSMGLIPPVARRLGPLTAVAYGLLESVPFARSHYVGRLRKI